MFVLARVIALITLYGMPVQLLPAYSNQNAAIGPYLNRNTSPRTIRFPEQFFRHVNNKPLAGKTLKEIQYAPLYVDAKATVTTNKSVGVTTTASIGKGYDEHLEPKTTDIKNQNTKCYHHNRVENIQALPSVSRSPGHNAIYRSYPLIVPRDKPFKLNFIKPIAVKQHMEHLPVASTTVAFVSSNRISPPFMTNQQYIVNPDISDKDINLGPAKPKRPPFLPFNKLHRLHLNIARVYSPVSQKSPSYSGAYSMNVDSDHAQLESDLPAILHLSYQSEDKTVKSVTQK